MKYIAIRLVRTYKPWYKKYIDLLLSDLIGQNVQAMVQVMNIDMCRHPN